MAGRNEYGEQVRGIPQDRDGLIGIDEIGAYSGLKDSRTLKKFMKEHAFPMTCIGGLWFSSKRMVDEWRQEKIRQSMRKKAENAR